MFSLLGIFLEFKWRYYYKYLRNIELLILDVDGVLTDGGLWVDHNGNTMKKFDVKDGLGIKLLQEIGIKIVLLSGGASGATEERASQLGIEYYLVGIKNKFDKKYDMYDRGGDFRRICLSNELGDMELDEPELNYYDSKFK